MPAFMMLGVALVAFVLGTRTRKKDTPRPEGGQHFELDQGMPETAVHQVLSALVHSQDPAQLEALAHAMEKFPLSASELRAKATALRAASEPHPSPAPSPVPHHAAAATTHEAPHAAAPTAHDARVEPHPETAPAAHDARSDVANILQAAMRALVEERDPVALEGFAESIRATFPTAATLLAARAGELRVGAPIQTPATPAAPHHLLLSTTHATPVVPSQAYVVKAGDTVSALAHRFTHNGKRWPELVAANPAKPKASDGNFASLRPGETLTLPASWAAPAPNGAPVTAAPPAANEIHT